jgi:hypothetical protein
MTILMLFACRGYDAVVPTPVLTTLTVSLADSLEVGEMDFATAGGLDQYGEPIAAGTVKWSSADPTIAAVSPATGAILAIAPGTTQITATDDGGRSAMRVLVVSPAPAIRINEVKTSRGSSRVWVEIVNATPAPIDISGWIMTNKAVLQSFTFPLGMVIQPGGLVVVDEVHLPFGLGADGAVLLFTRFGVLVDRVDWSAEVATTYGRCPNETSAFVPTIKPTEGAANECPRDGQMPAPLETWQ